MRAWRLPSLIRAGMAVRGRILSTEAGNSCSRGLATLPSHTMLSMPALSPTMTQGNIASWKVKAGDAIKAGAVVAEIETDKATVDLEVQEEGFVAKLLLAAGSKDIRCGSPIAVLVDHKDDVAAFADFALPAAAAAAPPPPAQPTPVTSAAPPKATTPLAPPKVAPAPSPVPSPSAAAPAPQAAPQQNRRVATEPSSPLETILLAERRAYEAKFGPSMLVIAADVDAKAQKAAPKS